MKSWDLSTLSTCIQAINETLARFNFSFQKTNEMSTDGATISKIDGCERWINKGSVDSSCYSSKTIITIVIAFNQELS